MQEAAERYRRALENLKRKQEAVERALKNAESTYEEIQRKMARLQQEMGRTDFRKKLKKLTQLLNDFSRTKARLEATKATIKNLKQAFRQKLHRIASSKNKNVQPDAPRGKDSKVADPVNLVTGAFVIEQTDAALPGRSFPLAVNRNYSNQIYSHGSFGRKWTSWFDAYCRKMKSGAVYFWLGNGQGVWFLLDGNGGYEENSGSEWRLEKNGSRFSLINVEGAVQQFDSNGRIQKISDRFGNWARVSRNEQGHVTSLRNSEGRELTITGSPIREIKDKTGRIWKYRYDNRGHLVQVTMPATKKLPKGRSTFFEYENHSDPRMWGSLKLIRNTRREVVLGNIYGTKPETFNRVVEQEDEDEIGLLFQYSLLKKTEDWLAPDDSTSEDATKIDFNEAVHRTVFTNALGIKTSYDFNEAGQPLESVLRAGSKNAESIDRSEYDSAGNLIAVHQPMGQAVRFKRDTKNQDPFRRGNAVEIRQHPSGTGAARVTKINTANSISPSKFRRPMAA